MERKIGEIFECNGEWYQCIKGLNCLSCFFNGSENCDKMICSVDERTDSTSVFFKKLEKWGKPYPNADKLYQLYILPMNIEKLPTHTEGINLVRFDIVEIEIKQTKDMGERDDIRPYDEYFSQGTVSNTKHLPKSNLKPFDIEAAKEGKPVCTRDGRKARIICFDRKLYHDGYNYPIVAMVNDNDNELVHAYTQDGLLVENAVNELDLMMLPEKKEGWVNVYRDCDGANITKDDNIYSSKDAAIASAQIIDGDNYIATTIIKWEE